VCEYTLGGPGAAVEGATAEVVPDDPVLDDGVLDGAVVTERDDEAGPDAVVPVAPDDPLEQPGSSTTATAATAMTERAGSENTRP